jgi:spore coat protein A, manganese oxidase
VDAHPIHIHLIQFQLLNRQAVVINPDTGLPTYLDDWGATFPGGVYNGETADGSWGPVTYPPGTVIPGYGPPGDYCTPNADGALGGNLAFSPYLTGPVIPPNPSEAGWKDTAIVSAGYVTRYAVRWAPLGTAIDGVSPGQNLYSFDPTEGPAYLVHCHIIDHEDNEMMRPYIPTW